MEFNAERRIILASGSPRRKELLTMVGVPFDVVTSEILEDDYIEGTGVSVYAKTLAYNKAFAVAGNYPDAVVIGADTVVAIGDYIYPKPQNEQEAKKFLKELSGKTHTVITGVTIIMDGDAYRFANPTSVTFYDLDDSLIDKYIASGDPFDKAGAYGIQTAGALFVEKIVGDYYSVVGLPISLVTKHLRTLGIISLKDGAAKHDR